MLRFHNDPFEAVAWMDQATATDYATFAPLVMRHADAGDPVARRIIRDAAEQIDELVRRLAESGASRVALLGGLASSMQPWLAPDVQRRLVPVEGDAIDGALCLARRARHRRARTQGADMTTEHIDPRYVDLDSWSAAEMIAAMHEGQVAAAAAVRDALGALAAAVDDAVPALQRGGRIVYVGAGTSGRIGVQDGVELHAHVRLARGARRVCDGGRNGRARAQCRRCRGRRRLLARKR